MTWRTVKNIGLALLSLAVIAAVLLIGKQILEVIRGVGLGKVSKPNDFMRIPGDESEVLVRDGASWKRVALPSGTSASKVSAVSVTQAGTAIVEVKHAGLDEV